MKQNGESNGIRVHKACKAIVANPNGEILLLRLNLSALQLGHSPELGIWDIPGGRIREGETESEALIREIREETGLEARIVAPLTDFEFSPREGTVVAGKCYLCRSSGNEVRLDDPEKEHSGYEWMPIGKAASHGFVGWLQNAIRAAERELASSAESPNR